METYDPDGSVSGTNASNRPVDNEMHPVHKTKRFDENPPNPDLPKDFQGFSASP